MNSKEKIEELLEASRDGTITAAQATEVGKFKVKKMEVTPLLWSLYLDYDEAMKVCEDEKTSLSTQVRTMAWIFITEQILTSGLKCGSRKWFDFYISQKRMTGRSGIRKSPGFCM